MAQLFKLGEVVNGKQLASGLFAGMEQTEGPLWADGQNIVFDEGVVKKIPGKEYIADLGETIYGIAQGRVDNADRIVEAEEFHEVDFVPSSTEKLEGQKNAAKRKKARKAERQRRAKGKKR